MRSLYFISIILTALIFSGCFKEQEIIPDIGSDVFNFIMTEDQEKEIIESRDLKLVFSDPLPFLQYSNAVYDLDQFKLRGESSLRYRRKGFSVNMDDNLFLFVESEGRIREFEKIKLIALVADYTYIENFIAIGIFRELNLWPLHSFYTEVRLNYHTQGVYLFIEDLEDYFMYQQDADFVLRRNYQNGLDGWEINDQKMVESKDYYLDRFSSIYSHITKYSGKQLYDSLMHLVDMPQYFAKISVDMLLKNGDYTDEIFFYTKEMNGRNVFGICPWDYDDLFMDLPHEIGKDWGIGNLFGERSYLSIDDVIADVGEKLLFSIEDDLDYKIAIDDYLYQQYLIILENVVYSIDDIFIENVFSDAKETLQPFYNNSAIIDQSKYDKDLTNQVLFDNNLFEKKQFLLNRRQWIINELPKHVN